MGLFAIHHSLTRIQSCQLLLISHDTRHYHPGLHVVHTLHSLVLPVDFPSHPCLRNGCIRSIVSTRAVPSNRYMLGLTRWGYRSVSADNYCVASESRVRRANLNFKSSQPTQASLGIAHIHSWMDTMHTNMQLKFSEPTRDSPI